MKIQYFLIFFVFLIHFPAQAEECRADNRPCVIALMLDEARKIDNAIWRDQTYREIAKTLAMDGDTAQALALLDKIETPDTKAMTIRGIGMALTENGSPPESHPPVFAALRSKAEEITHLPSYAIALTYIAMAQAFAGDNDGAWKTASDMENDALRHKAYGETAEIQAEHHDDEAAMKSIAFIESEAYRNKAYSTVSKILADRGLFEEAFQAARAITNSYKKTQALQIILDAQAQKDKK